jgi:hypothetical protein
VDDLCQIESKKDQPKPVFEISTYLFICQCLRRTKLDARRSSITDIALHYFIMNIVNQCTAKRTGGHAGHTSDTTFHIDIHSTRFGIAFYGIKQA